MTLRLIKDVMNISARLCQPLITQKLAFHNTPSVAAWEPNKTESGPTRWLENNKKIYPPQEPGEEPRPAFVCHQRENIKYSPKKMWYIACLVRGMSVDEAIKQLKFVTKKGAKDVREVIEEAKALAVQEHNVEFASNLWVAESFSGKGMVIKGLRRHARGRRGLIRYSYCHYFVRLEEGKPPKKYYASAPKEPHEMLEDWMTHMRRRKVFNSI
ncbi:39S ribosomal protein L22, mitochondrial [Dendroctonus ponderosae]